MFGNKNGNGSAPRNTGRTQQQSTTPTQTQGGRAFGARGRFGGATARQNASRIGAGTYVVEVEEMSWLTSKNPKTKGNEMFVCQFTILEVLANMPNEPGYESSNVAGQRVSHIVNTSKNEETAFSVIKNLFLAMARTENPEMAEEDLSPEEWDDALEEAIAPPGTKCKGVRLIMAASRTRTREDRPFTAISYNAPG